MEVPSILIERCRRQEEKAFYELYRTCYSMIMSITSRYVREQADRPAVANHCFVRIVNSLKMYDDGRNFGAWAYRIAVNVNLDYLREQKKIALVHMEEGQLDRQLSDHGVAEINYAELMFNAETLQQMIDRLPPRTAQVFNLFAIDGFSHDEIAEQLNMSPGTSKWHVSTARQQLQSLLKQYSKDKKAIHVSK